MALAPGILGMGSHLGRWSGRAYFHCSGGILDVLAQTEACATKDGAN